MAEKVKFIEKLLVVIITLVCFAFLANVVSYAGISGTKHDLSTGGPGPIKAAPASGVSESCVFCHTPHSGTGDYPLWNHTLSTASYTMPRQQTAPWSFLLSPTGWGGTPGTYLPQPDKGAKLCLGCHDGTVAVGAVINTPGRGSTGLITMTDSGSGYLTAGGALSSTAPGYFGTDLTNMHHPFSIAVNDAMINDKILQCGPPNCQGSMAIQYPPSGDPVKLRPTANTYKAQVGVTCGSDKCGVQCRSCHDPHSDPQPGVTKFLVRGSPSNYDPLCNTCHILCPNPC